MKSFMAAFVYIQNHLSLWNTDMLICMKQFKNFEITDMCLLETNTSQNSR